jgi:FkbM family methyltransferase
MKLLRILLLKILGLKNYLRTISTTYLFLVKNGCMKKKYPELFYLPKIIKKGDFCLDIGANLGYYSYFMAKYCGNNGRMIAIEPVPLFGTLWKRNVPFAQAELWPYALGESNKKVEMGMPEINGLIHHGMTRVILEREKKYKCFFEVEMKTGDHLFGDLEKIDFIKCDIEGYEHLVFSHMTALIKKHRPLIQTELSNKNTRKEVFDLFENFAYSICVLQNQQLQEADEQVKQNGEKDFYFVPKK